MTAHAVGTFATLWDGDLIAVDAAGVRLIVIRLGDRVHAYADRCPHLGVPLSEGVLEGGILTCLAHHWQYDAATGQGTNPRGACLVRYPVAVHDGVIYVETSDG